jgi:hypothetical protein
MHTRIAHIIWSVCSHRFVSWIIPNSLVWEVNRGAEEFFIYQFGFQNWLWQITDIAHTIQEKRALYLFTFSVPRNCLATGGVEQ